MDEKEYSTYIEANGERRYFQDIRYKEPFLFAYDHNEGKFYGFQTNNKYAEIKACFDVNREVKCRVMCGASYFELRLSRHIYDGGAFGDNMFSFDTLTYNGQGTYWFVNLRIWEDNSYEYSEGNYSVIES